MPFKWLEYLKISETNHHSKLFQLSWVSQFKSPRKHNKKEENLLKLRIEAVDYIDLDFIEMLGS